MAYFCTFRTFSVPTTLIRWYICRCQIDHFRLYRKEWQVVTKVNLPHDLRLSAIKLQSYFQLVRSVPGYQREGCFSLCTSLSEPRFLPLNVFWLLSICSFSLFQSCLLPSDFDILHSGSLNDSQTPSIAKFHTVDSSLAMLLDTEFWVIPSNKMLFLLILTH